MRLRMLKLLTHVTETVYVHNTFKYLTMHYTLCLKKNVLTLKRYSSKLYGSILTSFGRNVQNTLE